MAKIMLVEDDTILRKVMCDVLVFIGHEADTSMSISEFKGKLEAEEEWDLVITDFCLDTHTCHRVLELANNQGLPIMVFTGHDVDKVRAELPHGTPTFCKFEAGNVRAMEQFINEQLLAAAS